jgi:hypothetical protein
VPFHAGSPEHHRDGYVFDNKHMHTYAKFRRAVSVTKSNHKFLTHSLKRVGFLLLGGKRKFYESIKFTKCGTWLAGSGASHFCQLGLRF